MNKVYVVTCPQLGWNNVVGVFTYDLFEETLKEAFPDDQYIITERTVESNLDDWRDEDE